MSSRPSPLLQSHLFGAPGLQPLRVWIALGLTALLPFAAALDPSGSTEPNPDSEPRAAISRSAAPQSRPAIPSAPPAPVSPPSASAAPSNPATSVSAPARGDIADTALLSPDGSSSIESAGGTAVEPAAATALARREPLRLNPARPSIAGTPTIRQWSSLSEEQRSLLAPFEEQWSDLPKREKQVLADLAQRFPEVSGNDQERSMKRLAEWAELTPEDRRLARYNYRWMQGIERRELLEAWERYQSLTPDQRAVLAAVGLTSNTGARHPGRRTGLAADAAQPLPRRTAPPPELPGL